jgi:hypothetical protein
MEVKVYKQKVKHLLYEQENHLAELKAESMVSVLFLFGNLAFSTVLRKWFDYFAIGVDACNHLPLGYLSCNP